MACGWLRWATMTDFGKAAGGLGCKYCFRSGGGGIRTLGQSRMRATG